jgi:hypothetical protein
MNCRKRLNIIYWGIKTNAHNVLPLCVRVDIVAQNSKFTHQLT